MQAMFFEIPCAITKKTIKAMYTSKTLFFRYYTVQKSLPNKEVFQFFVSGKNYGLNFSRSLSCPRRAAARDCL